MQKKLLAGTWQTAGLENEAKAAPLSVAKFIVPDSRIGLSCRPASLCSLADRCDNPMPESTLYLQSGTMKLAIVKNEIIADFYACNILCCRITMHLDLHKQAAYCNYNKTKVVKREHCLLLVSH